MSFPSFLRLMWKREPNATSSDRVSWVGSLPCGKTPWSSSLPCSGMGRLLWSGCLCWNERSLQCAASSTVSVSLWVRHCDQAGPLISLLCFDGWFQSALFTQAPLLGFEWCNKCVNEWIMHYSSSCVSVKQVQRHCSLRDQCVAAPGGGWSLPQAPAEAQISGSCVCAQLTWLQGHCSCFGNKANRSHQTCDDSALLTSGLHVPHRNTRECALEARGRVVLNRICIKLCPFVRSKVVFFMLFCVFCCHHWKINKLCWYKNSNIGICWYLLQNVFFYIPQNVDLKMTVCIRSQSGNRVACDSEGKNSTAGLLRFLCSLVLSFENKENMEMEISLNKLDCHSIRILKTWSKITGKEACSVMGFWNFHDLNIWLMMLFFNFLFKILMKKFESCSAMQCPRPWVSAVNCWLLENQGVRVTN